MRDDAVRDRPNRRAFLRRAAVLPLAAAVAPPPGVGPASSQARRRGAGGLKTALNAYSFLEPLTVGAADPAKGTDLFRLCDFCAEHGFDGIDLTAYFFPGYPKAPPDDYVFALKRRAFDLGLGISGTGVRNDFTATDRAVRAEGVQRVKEWIEVAAKLGAPVIRVFADAQSPFKTWQEASRSAARAEVEGWIAEAVRECAVHGAKFGVIVGVQNHADFVATAAEHLSLLKRIDHPWCGVIVDTGKYVSPDPYADIALAAPRAVNWQVKETLTSRADGPRADLRRLVGIIRASGYRGYVPIETLAMGRKDYDPFVLAPRLHAELREAIAAAEAGAP